MSVRRKFDIELLNNIIQRDNATIINEYTTLTRNSIIYFRCSCNNVYSKTFQVIALCSGLFCRKCTVKHKQEKAIKTNLEKYGTEYGLQNTEIKEKKNKTVLNKYGVNNVSQSEEIKNRKINTSLKTYGVNYQLQSDKVKNDRKKVHLEKHGVEYNIQREDVKEKIKNSNINKYGVESVLKSDIIRKKIKNTMLEKYNVEYPTQSNEIKEKIKNVVIHNNIREQIKKTNLTRYGVEHATQSTQIKNKIRQRNLEKYGVEHITQIKEVREKVKQTNLIKYGVEYVTQSKEVQEKIQKNSKKFKSYTMPSGVIRKVQGYEPFALDILTKIYTEEQIKTDRKDVPRVKYIVDEKNKYYFPDIFIPHENKLIEVKSTWTYKCKSDNIQLKKDACIAEGYNYEIWCFNRKGEKINPS